MTGLLPFLMAALMAAPAPNSGACALPVYLKSGEVRCADRPAVSAFGRLTWMEKGRTFSLPVSKVDMKRTLPKHRNAPRSGRGGFTMMGTEGSAAVSSPMPQTAPSEGRIQPGRYPVPNPDPVERELGRQERADYQAELQRLVTEREVMLKQYKLLVASGRAPSNTLSSAINSREKRIEAIREILRR